MNEDADLYDKAPEIDEELIEVLREQFRDAQPVPGDTLSDLMYVAGQQSVISWLTYARETQLQRQRQDL